MKKRIVTICAAAAVLFGGCASQSAAYSEPDYVEYTNGSGAGNSAVYDAKADESYEAEYAAAETAEGGSYTAETPAPDPSLLQEKLVYNGDLLIETLKYEESAAQLKELISSYNGIIEWQDEYDGNYNWYTGESSGTRTMTMTVRIPTEHFDEFMNNGDGVGKVISRSTGVTNISRQYYDTSIQIEALEKQQTRLLEMMDKAETIQDMIAVEQRLTDVQTQLNSLKTHRQSMDTDVMYSTVTVRLNEVKEYVHDNESFFERAGNAFISGWKNFVWFLEDMFTTILYLLPYILIIGIIAFVIVKKDVFHLPKFKGFKKKNKEENKENDTEES